MKVYVVVPDIHVPFHCPSYLKVVASAIRILKPHGIVQLGDALDFWQVSRFEKDPSRKESIFDDIVSYNKIIAQWLDLLGPRGEFHQLEGNHEARLTRYIWAQAKELNEIVRPLPELLGFNVRKNKCTWYPYKRWDALQIGDCTLHHGFYYNQHVAMGNLTRYPTSIITGHTHGFQYVSNGAKFSVTLGHGSDPQKTSHQPTPSTWQQAFGVLRVRAGRATFEPVFVSRGRAVLNGEVIGC